jgi:hypothetical protein
MSRAEQEPQKRSFVSRSFETWGRVATSIPRTAALSMVGPGLLIVFGYVFWVNWGAAKIDHTYFALSSENIIVTNPPTWVRSNIASEVFQGSGIKHVSLQDREACSIIASAFTQHPWIERVHRVSKLAGAQVKVDVEFRRPFACVYCEKRKSAPAVPQIESVSQDPTRSSDNVEKVYYIVDVYGVNLPSRDFDPKDIFNYVHIYCPDLAPPTGPEGSIYEDTRVLNSLRICELLQKVKVQFDVESINVMPENSQHPNHRWVYEIVLKGNRAIYWGHAPGEETAGEDNAQAKLQKIQNQLSSGVAAPESPS